MCGIIVSNLEIDKSCYNKIKNRGPDKISEKSWKGFNFVHFLLHITGEMTPQPIIENDLCLIFNGEIYNYKEIKEDAKSDGYSILESYRRNGEDFVKKLDGDFTVVLFDFEKNLLFISSDTFATKPLFYVLNQKEITISSYPLRNNKTSLESNQTIIFSLDEMKILKKKTVCDFDLNQHKTNYDDFNLALEEAILKRYPEKEIPLLNLSAGMDSGLISCVLNKFGKKAIYVTFRKNEDADVLRRRKKILEDQMIFLNLDEEDRKIYRKKLDSDCEKFMWDWSFVPSIGREENGFEMGSMLAKCKTFERVKEINKEIKVCYSGIGGDEIMTKGKYYCHGAGNPCEFKKNLSSIFPWENFYKGSMRNYIKGDEYVGGMYAFETRFPYCDKKLVQEFLWLDHKLKNKYLKYDQKAPLAQYLEKENYPFPIKKTGFSI